MQRCGVARVDAWLSGREGMLCLALGGLLGGMLALAAIVADAGWFVGISAAFLGLLSGFVMRALSPTFGTSFLRWALGVGIGAGLAATGVALLAGARPVTALFMFAFGFTLGMSVFVITGTWMAPRGAFRSFDEPFR